MRAVRFLTFGLFLFAALPLFLGCGGGAETEDDQGQLAEEDDPTLTEDDTTMVEDTGEGDEEDPATE